MVWWPNRYAPTHCWRQWRKQLTQADTWREISNLKQALRQERFDFVLDSQGLFKSALFARMAAAPIKGLDAASAREAGASWFYQQKFAVQKGLDAVLRNRLHELVPEYAPR